MNKEEGTANVREEATYCVFKVGGRNFFLPVELVREVTDVAPLFKVPMAPEYIYGVVPLRGRIIPAIDLSKIYPTDKPVYGDAKLVVVDVEVKLMKEVINENIGFISEGLPYFTTFGSDILVSNVLDVKDFFKNFRVKEPYGRV